MKGRQPEKGRVKSTDNGKWAGNEEGGKGDSLKDDTRFRARQINWPFTHFSLALCITRSGELKLSARKPASQKQQTNAPVGAQTWTEDRGAVLSGII